MREGEIVNMQDGPYEVAAVPERGLIVLEPIVRRKEMSLIRHNKKEQVKVTVIRRRSNIVINPGSYIDFYI